MKENRLKELSDLAKDLLQVLEVRTTSEAERLYVVALMNKLEIEVGVMTRLNEISDGKLNVAIFKKSLELKDKNKGNLQ